MRLCSRNYYREECYPYCSVNGKLEILEVMVPSIDIFKKSQYTRTGLDAYIRTFFSLLS